ncbi:hypothetical protein PMIN02_001167 [Paraphaeosphaeria minitans]
MAYELCLYVVLAITTGQALPCLYLLVALISWSSIVSLPRVYYNVAVNPLDNPDQTDIYLVVSLVLLPILSLIGSIVSYILNHDALGRFFIWMIPTSFILVIIACMTTMNRVERYQTREREAQKASIAAAAVIRYWNSTQDAPSTKSASDAVSSLESTWGFATDTSGFRIRTRSESETEAGLTDAEADFVDTEDDFVDAEADFVDCTAI